jgi:hypothetical protein
VLATIGDAQKAVLLLGHYFASLSHLKPSLASRYSDASQSQTFRERAAALPFNFTRVVPHEGMYTKLHEHPLSTQLEDDQMVDKKEEGGW